MGITSGKIDYAQYVANGGIVFTTLADALNNLSLNKTSNSTSSTIITEVPENYSARKEYIETAIPIIIDTCKKYGFKYPSVVVSQMIWESGDCKFWLYCKVRLCLVWYQSSKPESRWMEILDKRYGAGHADGGNARVYEQYSDFIYDYV